MKVNLVALPCPKCKQPIPVEASTCPCGHRLFLEQAPAEPSRFPPIQTLLPELENTFRPAASEERSDAPAPEQIPERPSAPTSPTLPVTLAGGHSAPLGEPAYREISIFAESQPEPSRRWRVIVPAGALATALVVFGAWGGYFGSIESALGGSDEQPAESVEKAGQSDVQAEAPALQDPTVVADTPASAFERPGQSALIENEGRTVEGRRDPLRRDPRESSRSAPRTLIPQAERSSGKTTAETAEAATAEPRTSANRAVPVALCGDGTYSYSRSGGDPCAQRGGVAERFTPGRPVTEVTPPEARSYVLGPRGGCYYLNASGKKVYVKKELCG